MRRWTGTSSSSSALRQRARCRPLAGGCIPSTIGSPTCPHSKQRRTSPSRLPLTRRRRLLHLRRRRPTRPRPPLRPPWEARCFARPQIATAWSACIAARRLRCFGTPMTKSGCCATRCTRRVVASAMPAARCELRDTSHSVRSNLASRTLFRSRSAPSTHGSERNRDERPAQGSRRSSRRGTSVHSCRSVARQTGRHHPSSPLHSPPVPRPRPSLHTGGPHRAGPQT